MQTPDDAPAPLPRGHLEHFPEHAKLIAFIIAEWSHIEYHLIVMLASVSRAKQGIIHPMLYAVQSSASRLEAMKAAFGKLVFDEPRRTKIMQALDDARGVLTYRDKLGHALYGWFDVDGPHNDLAIVSQTDRRPSHVLPLHDLQHQYQRSKELNQRVASLMLFELLPRLPGVQVVSEPQQTTETRSDNPQNHPSPPEPPSP